MAIKVDAAKQNGTGEATILQRSTTAASDIGARVRTSAADSTAVVVKRAPAVLAVSLSSIERVAAALRTTSTEALALGTAFAAGASGGMLLSRVPRVLVMFAFVPAVVLGGALLERLAARTGEPARGVRTQA